MISHQHLSVLFLALVVASCSRDAGNLPVKNSAPDTAALVGSVGGIRGTIRDAVTDEAVREAQVSTGDLSALTDDHGDYNLAPVSPGSLELAVYQRGFLPESLTAVIESGVSTLIDFQLVPSESPCCELDGLWLGEFVLDSAGLNVQPASRNVSGELVFEGRAVNSPISDRTNESVGESRIEFQTILGSELDVLEEAEGAVFGGDSVAITLVPKFADWGLEMLGRMHADTVHGIWFQRASCCGAYGTFTLIRTAAAK